jgi:hypothetical protein
MAGAGKKRTTPPDLRQPTAKQQREFAARWVAAAPERAEAEAFRKAIDRHIAIRDHQIAPPWLNKSEQGGGLDKRIKRELRKLFPPKGRVPADISTTQVRARLEAECGCKAGWDSVARALGRRRD